VCVCVVCVRAREHVHLSMSVSIPGCDRSWPGDSFVNNNISNVNKRLTISWVRPLLARTYSYKIR
jgi:hypothetical protein